MTASFARTRKMSSFGSLAHSGHGRVPHLPSPCIHCPHGHFGLSLDHTPTHRDILPFQNLLLRQDEAGSANEIVVKISLCQLVMEGLEINYWAPQKNLVKGCRETLDCYCVSCKLLSASKADALLFVNILVSGIFHGRFAQRLGVNKPCLQIVRRLLWKQTTTHSIRNKNAMFEQQPLFQFKGPSQYIKNMK